jgi:hypothetical protein
MSRKIHPARFVTFVRDHVEVTPETVLESTEMRTGTKYVIATIPESRREYKRGQVLEFGSVNAAKDFVKAMKGDAIVGAGLAPGAPR